MSEQHSFPRAAALAAFLLLQGAACDGGGTTMMPPPDDRPRTELLAHLGQNVILPAYRDLATAAAGLVTATDAYAAAPSSTTRTAAREAWAAAMVAAEHTEMMQLGPLGPIPPDGVMGGQDIRFEMYAWPALNLCVIDQDTASDRHTDATALAAETVDRRGLGAIEYLLFVDTSDNACSPLSPINEDGTWAAFTPEVVEARRARHAHTLATIVRDAADGLVAAWEGGFLDELTDPTRSGALYGSGQEGLQAVVDAMFYLDGEVKDMKLAEPMGLSLDCLTTLCPEARESRHANVSLVHVAENLRAFSRLYLGGDPGGDDPGFDDLLRDMGAGELADQMATHIAAAIVAVEAVPGALVEALTASFPELMAAYDAIKLVTNDLKGMFLTVLDLEAPNRAAGDND